MSAIPSVRVRTSGWQADVSETFLTHCEAQALANTDPKFMVTVLEAIGGTKGEKGDAGLDGIQGPKGDKGDKGDAAETDIFDYEQLVASTLL